MKKTTNEFSFMLKPSAIPNADVGVFAVHGIAKGTKLHVFPENNVSRILQKKDIPEELLKLCVILKDGLHNGPNEFNHVWIGWYMNHSHNPNTELRGNNSYYALSNISAGEEILINYNIFNEPEEFKEDYYREF